LKRDQISRRKPDGLTLHAMANNDVLNFAGGDMAHKRACANAQYFRRIVRSQ
jgi:hypothetical protein